MTASAVVFDLVSQYRPAKRLAVQSISKVTVELDVQESLALASMARDDSPASSTAAAAARRPPAARRPMRGKVGSEFET